ncbi:hypothetical protein BU17DRAFT_103906 [Hysterangium stoloniferum]|nr:hypothetical protein BU17DRAFT_103906 [Hysterangium stoloniferum]
MPFHPEHLGASGYADAHKVYVRVLDRSISPPITPAYDLAAMSLPPANPAKKKRHINDLLASYELSPCATTITLAGGNILEAFEGGGVGSHFRKENKFGRWSHWEEFNGS